MAERDASKVQLDFPQLTADVIAALRLTGTLGLFNFSDTVIPVISVGNVRPITAQFDQPAFTSATVFSSIDLAPALNLVLADTGPLPAGTYDCMFGMLRANDTGDVNCELQHRNAANAANLATWPSRYQLNAVALVNNFPLTFAYILATNERLRFQILTTAGSVSSRYNTFIMAQIRPTP